MHVLIIPSEEYIPEHNPIAGIFQHDQARIIQQNQNKVGVISFTFRFSFFSLLKAIIGKHTRHTRYYSGIRLLKTLITKIFKPFSSSLKFEIIDGVQVVRCDGFWGLRNNKSAMSLYQMWKEYGDYAIKEYIQKYGKPDIIHAHNMIYAGLFSSYLKKKYAIPVIITEHSSQYAMGEISNELFYELEKAFELEIPFFAVSPKLVELLESKFTSLKNKVEWLPNVLDPSIENIPIAQNYQNTRFRFLNVANLIPLKGQTELIEAFYEAFSDRLDKVELLIAGDGYLKPSLQKKIDELSLNDNVKLLGYIPREQVVKEMDKCNVFVLPSHYETFGVVLIEALSRGVPVISTYCGGPECIVNSSNGLLIEPKNINQLAESMSKMYLQSQNYQKEKLRAETLNEYGAHGFYERLNIIYSDNT